MAAAATELFFVFPLSLSCSVPSGMTRKSVVAEKEEGGRRKALIKGTESEEEGRKEGKESTLCFANEIGILTKEEEGRKKNKRGERTELAFVHCRL